jgi:hypothetical protein
MAIIEIAKIQVRRGQAGQTGLPQLDAGEFGWATDQQRLYIGNGNTDQNGDGAPAVGNTELITEHNVSNFFRTATSYTYQGNANTTVHTGPLGTGDTQRTLQAKLDDIVSIADFGVVGNGLGLTADGAPVYQQIQLAVDQIFNNNQTPRSRKTLYFPAGTYAITGTVFIPPFAKLVGEGASSTVLQASTSTISVGVYTATSVMQLVGTSGTNYAYFPNIGSNQNPADIVIEGIHFKYDPNLNPSYVEPLLRVDSSKDCRITHCKFEGVFSKVLSSAESYSGIDIRGSGIYNENTLIKDNVFESLRYGVTTSYDNVYDTVISDNHFNNLRNAIAYANPLSYAQNIGPLRSKIHRNKFENVLFEAIYVGGNNGTPTDHNSAFNTFREVGNNRNGDTSAVTSLINFGTSGNSSTEDRFDREDTLIKANNDAWTFKPSIKGRAMYQNNVAFTTTIQTSISTPVTLARIPYAGNDQTVKVQYILNKQSVGISRKGDLLVSVALGTTATVTDSYTYVGSNDGGMTFTANLNTVTNTIKVQYNSTNAIGTLEYKYSYLQ